MNTVRIAYFLHTFFFLFSSGCWASVTWRAGKGECEGSLLQSHDWRSFRSFRSSFGGAFTLFLLQVIDSFPESPSGESVYVFFPSSSKSKSPPGEGPFCELTGSDCRTSVMHDAKVDQGSGDIWRYPERGTSVLGSS